MAHGLPEWTTGVQRVCRPSREDQRLILPRSERHTASVLQVLCLVADLYVMKRITAGNQPGFILAPNHSAPWFSSLVFSRQASAWQTATESPAGRYQFKDSQAVTNPTRYYRVRSP
jgi:hypothetical protein